VLASVGPVDAATSADTADRQSGHRPLPQAPKTRHTTSAHRKPPHKATDRSASGFYITWKPESFQAFQGAFFLLGFVV